MGCWAERATAVIAIHIASVARASDEAMTALLEASDSVDRIVHREHV
jgi:hypothetical protein